MMKTRSCNVHKIAVMDVKRGHRIFAAEKLLKQINEEIGKREIDKNELINFAVAQQPFEALVYKAARSQACQNALTERV